MTFKKLITPILLILLVSLSLPAMANSGRIITMSGDVKVNGQPMSKSYRVKGGDKIVTGANSRVNIIMSDKSVLDLQPNTKFKLERFSFNQKAPKKSRSIMNLLSGSFRYISGLVGRVSHDNATIKMGTATVGIRGSAASFSFAETTGTASVSVHLGVMTMTFANGQTMKLKKNEGTVANTLTGQHSAGADDFVPDPAMAAANALVVDSSDTTLYDALSDAEKMMSLTLLVANQEQLGLSDDDLVAIVQALSARSPDLRKTIKVITQLVAKDEAMRNRLDGVTGPAFQGTEAADFQNLKGAAGGDSSGGGDFTGSVSVPLPTP